MSLTTSHNNNHLLMMSTIGGWLNGLWVVVVAAADPAGGWVGCILQGPCLLRDRRLADHLLSAWSIILLPMLEGLT